MKFKVIIALIILLFSGFAAHASHFLGGYILLEQGSAYNAVNISVITWTDPSTAGVDRCHLVVEVWNSMGDVKIGEVTALRVNGGFSDPYAASCDSSSRMGEYIKGTIKRNIYQAAYVLPSPERYLFRCTEVFWVESIVNMNISGEREAIMETSRFFNPTVMNISSPSITNDTAFVACLGGYWTGMLNIEDPDAADSLEYHLGRPRYGVPPLEAHASIPDSLGGGYFYVGDKGNPNWLTPALPGHYVYEVQVRETMGFVEVGTTSIQRVVEVKAGGCAVSQAPAETGPLFSIHPNPANEVMMVQAEGMVTLTDPLGRIQLQREVHGQQPISLEDLPTGTYFVTSSNWSGRVLRLIHTR